MRLVSVVTSTRSPDLDALADLAEQVVDLAADRADLDLGIEQAGRPDDLLDDDALGALQLVVGGRRRHEDRLAGARLPLVEAQRAVVERRRQPEAEVDQRLLARAVAFVHRRRSAAPSGATRRRTAGSPWGSSRAASAAARPARAPTGGASSSRSPCSAPSARASRGRTASAAARRCSSTSLLPALSSPSRSRSSSLMPVIARVSRSAGVT